MKIERSVELTGSAAANIIKVLEFSADKALELAHSNSVLGQPVQQDGITVVPISKLSVGFAGGSAQTPCRSGKKQSAPTGAGAKVDVIPLSFLVIDGSKVKLVNLKAGAHAALFDIAQDLIRTIKKHSKNN